MALVSDRSRLIAEAKAIQDDCRYGHFTIPVALGLLLAVQILDSAASARPGGEG